MDDEIGEGWGEVLGAVEAFAVDMGTQEQRAAATNRVVVGFRGNALLCSCSCVLFDDGSEYLCVEHAARELYGLEAPIGGMGGVKGPRGV